MTTKKTKNAARDARRVSASTKKAGALTRAPRNQAEANAVKDMYANPAANTGFGSTSQVNGGFYFPYRISLDYQQLLFLYRGSWIVRAIIDTVPEDMLKEFPTITTQLPPEDIEDFNRVIAKTMTLQKLIEGMKWGRLFGGALAIIILAGEDQRDLSKPLILDDVQPGSYRGLIVVDRWSGVCPSGDLISDIDNPAEYGLPESYQVTTEVSQTFVVHHSRVLRFTGRDLPLFEKQIQTYWGMSECEAVFQELQRRDYIEAGIADLVARAHVLTMKEDMLAQMLSGVGMTKQQYQDYVNRLSAVSQSISTNGILAVSNTGDVQALSYTFAGLRDIHDAAMENLAGAAGIPMSRLGREITGLGNSGEGTLQIYYDSVDQKRKREVTPILDKLLPVICMSAWGEVPDDFGYQYVPIRSMTAKERAELAKSYSETITSYANAGAFGQKTMLEEIKTTSGETGIGTNITDEMIASASEMAAPADMPGGEGDDEGGNGAKDSAVRHLFRRLMGGARVEA